MSYDSEQSSTAVVRIIAKGVAMADLLRIRASNGAGITWQFADEAMAGYDVVVDRAPDIAIHDGDVWHVELVNTESRGKTGRRKVATVRLVARVSTLQPWQRVTALDDHWIDPIDLRVLLAWLHAGVDVILIGPKGTGKTSLGYALCRTLGWQEPCKVDVAVIKKTADLFGVEAAAQGSTHFVRSALHDYLERAHVALRDGLDTQFLLLFDEINTVHAASTSGLHGFFDFTRQVTITTTSGPKTVRIPPNVHALGTMNVGYAGTFELSQALLDRFEVLRVGAMPRDLEARKLVKDTGISEGVAGGIVDTARALRDAANGNQVSFAPSYRTCLAVARLITAGIEKKPAFVRGFLGYYSGDIRIENGMIVVQPNTEAAKALAALRMKGVIEAKDTAADVATIPGSATR